MWVAVAAVGAAAIGAVVASDSARKARHSQEDAAVEAAELQKEETIKSRNDLKPWFKKGEWALGELQDRIEGGPGEFTEDPGYQFRLSEGQKALERSASASGLSLSGSALKAATRYGQDYASGEYSNFLNRYYQSLTPYQSMSGLGQTTATTSGQFGASSAADQAQSMIREGEARASGHIDQGNIYSNMGNQLAYGAGQYYGNQPSYTQTDPSQYTANYVPGDGGVSYDYMNL